MRQSAPVLVSTAVGHLKQVTNKRTLDLTAGSQYAYGDNSAEAACAFVVRRSKCRGLIWCLWLSPVGYLRHFGWFRRLYIRVASVGTGELIHFPPWYLAEPVESILEQISRDFSEEIVRYEIEIEELIQ